MQPIFKTPRALILSSVILASLAYLASGAAQALVGATPAAAAATSNLRGIAYEGGYWLNYDGGRWCLPYPQQYTCYDYDANHVDWPLRFIIYGNAEVDYVKHKLDGCGGDPTMFPNICNATATGPMQFYSSDGGDTYGRGTWSGEDEDSGQKTAVGCSWYDHMRVYARTDHDANYNPDYRFYVFMTVHQDYETVWPGCFPNKYRSYETTESHYIWRGQQIGWATYPNLSYQYNAEPNGEWSSNSFVESNGYVSYMYTY